MNTNALDIAPDIAPDIALGIDFGRVIMGGAHATGEQDTVFLDGTLEDALASPAMPGMWEAVPRLVALFDGRAWIISKCGDRIRQRTLAWLDRHDFYPRTGLDPGNVRFCRKRPEKAVHCADLGITHMIDDRPDVHRALEGIVPHRYLFGPQRRPSALPNPLTWADTEELITAAVRESRPERRAPATRRSR